MKKALISLVVILIVIIAGFYLISNSQSITGNTILDNSDKNNEVKTFTVTGSYLRFYIDGAENPDIRVNEGDKIRIEFTSEEGFHDWKVDEFNAATQKVNPGTAASIEFIADKKGAFEYYCSVGQHRANGMKGNLIVE